MTARNVGMHILKCSFTFCSQYKGIAKNRIWPHIININLLLVSPVYHSIEWFAFHTKFSLE